MTGRHGDPTADVKYWKRYFLKGLKGKGSPYSIAKRRVLELIPVLGSQPAGDVSHKPGSRLPLLSDKPEVTLATLKRAATNFAAWWTEARWMWTVCLRLLPDSVAAAIWAQALLRLSPASVRENVCNNWKKRKKSCFLDFEKKTKKTLKTYVQFQRPLNHSGL